LYKVGTRSEVVERTITYPEATISGTLNGCNDQNGWCSTTPMLSLSASEPVAGYVITLIEGTRNGEVFACNGASCDIPLLEGENAFTFWAFSSWGDSSRMGSLTARVDTQPPQVDGSLSGTAGEAGWYVSPVTFSASVSDPQPGSGIETFSYSLDGSGWTAYTAPVTVSDGLHTVTFRAQDLAGHVTEISQSVQVDTLPPQVNASLVGEQVNGWYLSQVTFTASASDNGSGVARIEYALDGSPWQSYNAPVTIGDGIHTLRVRAFDAAGNVTEHTPLTFQVDGTPPRIQLSEAWYIWESGELKVSDGQSGLSGVEIEIRNPQGRWQKVARTYEANGESFATDITWDRRFADGTLAPTGTYQVVVKALDRAGNFTQETASLHIPVPNAPTYTPAPTRTALPTPTHLTSLIPNTSHLTPETAIPSRTPVVSAFGAFPTPILDRQSPIPQSTNPQSSVLWGTAAVAAIGAATAYALEQRRKRKEEEARQRAEAAAEAARRNAAEEARKVHNWLQGKAMLDAQLREAEKAGASQEQIAALRQTGLTKGLGTALAATAVAIRLLVEKNRAQSENSHPPVSGGGGKALASLVRQPYPDSLTPANDEPPTFWDKLKQLWDTFWNWVTGKSKPAIATPSPTLPPSQIFITHEPTPTATPYPTSTPIPYQQYKTIGTLTEWELRVGGPVAHNAHQLLAQASQFYFWSNSDPGQNFDPPIPLNYDQTFPIPRDPVAYKRSWHDTNNVYEYTGSRVPFVCGDVPDWAYFMAGYNLQQMFPQEGLYPNRWPRSAYGYLTMLSKGGTLHIFKTGSQTFVDIPELGDVMIVQTSSDWGTVWDSKLKVGAEHVVLVSEVHGNTLDQVFVIEGNPSDGTIVQHTVQELIQRVPNINYLIYGHPNIPGSTP
jgi:hypothetical protein